MSDAAPWEDFAPAGKHGGGANAGAGANPTMALNTGGGNLMQPWQDYGKAQAQDPTAGMNWAQKAGAIVGSTAQDTIDAVKQRAHEMGFNVDAPSDADIANRRAQEQQLMDATTGGHVLHFALQAAPYVAAGFIPGMQGIAGGAALGALSGALTPTGAGESALMNTAVGGVLGGAIPGAIKGIGSAWGKLTGQGAATTAAEQLAATQLPEAADTGGLGGLVSRFTGGGPSTADRIQAAQALADRLRAAQLPEVAGVQIPQSAGALLDDAGLTNLQRGSQVKYGDLWQPWAQAQAQAKSEALQAATKSGENLEILQDLRAAGWQHGMAAAMANADPGAVEPAIGNLQASLAARQASPEAMRQGASAVFNQAQQKLAAMGENLTPEHLLEYRTGLNEGFNDGATRLGSKNAAVGAVKDDFTQALDAITGNQVSPVIKQFADQSVPVNQAAAARAVNQGFFTPEGLPAVTSTFQGIPNITPARLRQMIQSQSDLAPDVKANLQALYDQILKSQNVQALNAVSTPGGSATAANQYSAQMADLAAKRIRAAIGGVPVVGKIANPAWDIFAKGDQQQAGALMANALQNPTTVMPDMLDTYVKSLTPSQKAQFVSTALRQATATGATAQ